MSCLVDSIVCVVKVSGTRSFRVNVYLTFDLYGTKALVHASGVIISFSRCHRLDMVVIVFGDQNIFLNFRQHPRYVVITDCRSLQSPETDLALLLLLTNKEFVLCTNFSYSTCRSLHTCENTASTPLMSY